MNVNRTFATTLFSIHQVGSRVSVLFFFSTLSIAVCCRYRCRFAVCYRFSLRISTCVSLEINLSSLSLNIVYILLFLLLLVFFSLHFSRSLCVLQCFVCSHVNKFIRLPIFIILQVWFGKMAREEHCFAIIISKYRHTNQ